VLIIDAEFEIGPESGEGHEVTRALHEGPYGRVVRVDRQTSIITLDDY
jgi:hypothetical protein